MSACRPLIAFVSCFATLLFACGEEEIRLITIGPYRQAYELPDIARYKFAIAPDRSVFSAEENNVLVAQYDVSQPTETGFWLTVNDGIILKAGTFKATFQRSSQAVPYGCNKAFVYTIELSNDQFFSPYIPGCD